MSAKRIAMLVIALVFIAPTAAVPADDAKFTANWNAPTTMGQNCTGTTPITGTWTYTLEYRVQGSTTWTPLEVSSPPVTVTGLYWGTTYEVRVGAHRFGYPVVCPTDPVLVTTAAEPAPGSCGSLTVTK